MSHVMCVLSVFVEFVSNFVSVVVDVQNLINCAVRASVLVWL